MMWQIVFRERKVTFEISVAERWLMFSEGMKMIAGPMFCTCDNFYNKSGNQL